MRRPITIVTERSGINFMRKLFEDANCIFKEIDQRHDVGQDAFVLLVDGEQVTAKEIALQIKSGRSYCRGAICSIPTDRAHLEFWRQHPVPTYGIVFDPVERAAFWTNLTEHAEDRHFGRTEPTNMTVRFKKSEWNRIDRQTFHKLFFPFLMRRPLQLTLEESLKWAASTNVSLRELGIGTLLRVYRNTMETWNFLIKAFQRRSKKNISPQVISCLAHIPTHYDILSYFSTGIIDPEIRRGAREQISKFDIRDVYKLLQFVDDDGFGRSTIGQDVGAIILVIDGHKQKLKEIALDKAANSDVREAAKELLREYKYLPIHPRSAV